MDETLIGYARCPTDEQDLTAQRQALHALGVAPDRVDIDHGSSGTKRERPGGWLYSDSFRSIGIVVMIFAIVLAALSLVLDFGTIEAGVQAGAPKEFEWYLGFGLMVTLIWLYISILKLLALLARNR